MDSAAILEQARLVIELLGAALLLTVPICRRERDFRFRISICIICTALTTAVCLALGCLWAGTVSLWIEWILYILWQILLLLLSARILRWCFEIRTMEILIILTDAYALRQACDVIINEIIAEILWPQLQYRIGGYCLLCIVIIPPLFLLYAHYQVPVIKAGIAYEIRDDAGNRMLHGSLLTALLIFSTGNGYLLLFTEDHVHLVVCVINIAACVLIWCIQHAAIACSAMYHDQERLDELMKERQKQYDLSSEVITALNHKYHDLKHQLLAMQEMDPQAQQSFLRETQQLIQDYDISAHTQSEVLNVLLVEKLSYCRKHGIEFTYMADASGLSFIPKLELYTLLGNALDNAIECVREYDDPSRRMISMNITRQKGCMFIQVANCFEGTMNLLDGLPVSTKNNARDHGFGTRSMRMVAQRYDGDISFTAQDGMFLVDIIIPIPADGAESTVPH